MHWVDCNCRIGTPAQGGRRDGIDADGLVREMDRAGIERAVVWHVAQLDAGPLTGNELLSKQIADRSRLGGCWSLLPPATGEMGEGEGEGEVSRWFDAARAAGVVAVRAWPETNRYLLRGEVLGEVFEELAARAMPLFWRPRDPNVPTSWSEIYDLLREHPALTVVLCNVGCWGSDRLFRPLLAAYPNVCMETSEYILDGGVESFVESYGAERLLFGSNFPIGYMGSMMLAIKHSDLAQADKELIASGNAERLFAGTAR